MRSKTQPVLNQIEEAVRDIPGWSPVDQLFSLYLLTASVTGIEGDVLELGAWCGRSTVALGFAVEESQQGKVHSVDLFPDRSDWFQNEDGTYSFAVTIQQRCYRSYDEQTVWAEPFQRDIEPLYKETPSLFKRFQKTVAKHNLQNTVQPFRGDLPAFLEQAGKNFKCRLAFIDAHHGYEAVTRDIQAILPHLSEGGWLCFDDAFTTYEGVDRALRENILDNPGFEQSRQLTRKLFAARKRIKK